MALRLLPGHLIGEFLRTGCPWSQALPPAGRRQFADALDTARGRESAEVSALLIEWQDRAALFTR